MEVTEVFALVQVLFAILVFAIGLPTIILQVSVDDRVARLVHKRLPAGGSQVAMIMGLSMLLAVLWFPAAGSSCPLMRFSTFLGIDGGAQRVILSVSFAAVIIFWYRLLSQDLRIELARDLEERVKKSFRSGAGIDPELLEDFVFLGEFSTPGHRKELVINALNRIRKSVQEGAFYGGGELDDMIRMLPVIVTNSAEPGNDLNYVQCGDLLGGTWRTLKRFDLHEMPDGVNCVHSIEKLIVSALDTCTESTCRELMEKIHDVEDIFFRVGVESLKREKFRLAVASLSRLEGLFSRSGAALFELVGLSAHFLAHGGSTLERGKKSLEKVRSSESWLGGGVFKDAVEYFDSIGELTTSYRVREHLLRSRV